MNAINTLTDIANLALARLGEPPLNSIDDDAAKARAVRLLLPQVIRREQGAFDWPELREEMTLAADATPLADGRNRFALPSTCLGVLRAADAAGYECTFERVGLWLYADSAELAVRLILYSETVAVWGVGLRDVIAFGLAVDVAPTLTQRPELAQGLRQELEQVVRPRAYRVAAQNGERNVNAWGETQNYRTANSRLHSLGRF